MRTEKGRRASSLARQFIDRIVFTFAAVFCLSLLSGCSPQQQAPANAPAPGPPANVANNAANNAPTTRPSTGATAKFNLPITLPLLDAMLAEEDFVADLKNNAGL